jgi:beta-lactam-binding protein with PASTA domain
MNIKNFVWTLPFLCFIFGYIVLHYFFAQPTVIVPSFLGKQLIEAQTIASNLDLSLRILNQKEDDTLMPGTILHQTPSAGLTIKKNQAIFCVVSRKPPLQYAPNFIGKLQADIEQHAAKNEFALKIYPIEYSAPRGYCVAQIPNADQPLMQKQIIVYISQGPCTLKIMPSFYQQPISAVTHMLNEHQIPYSITQGSVHYARRRTEPLVIDQRPDAGSIVDFAKPPLVQLYVE